MDCKPFAVPTISSQRDRRRVRCGRAKFSYRASGGTVLVSIQSEHVVIENGSVSGHGSTGHVAKDAKTAIESCLLTLFRVCCVSTGNDAL